LLAHTSCLPACPPAHHRNLTPEPLSSSPLPWMEVRPIFPFSLGTAADDTIFFNRRATRRLHRQPPCTSTHTHTHTHCATVHQYFSQDTQKQSTFNLSYLLTPPLFTLSIFFSPIPSFDFFPSFLHMEWSRRQGKNWQTAVCLLLTRFWAGTKHLGFSFFVFRCCFS